MAFEIFGFDVILDANLKPVLLEVNTLPSLSSSSELDKRIKTSLMCDAFNLTGVVPYKLLKKQEKGEKLFGHLKVYQTLGQMQQDAPMTV